MVMGITSSYQNTQFQKLFLFIDTRFDQLVVDSFLDLQPKGGAISINNFETCDVIIFRDANFSDASESGQFCPTVSTII